MTSPNTSLVPDTKSKPSITLNNLPREIKDQIYDYVIGGDYRVLPPGYRQRYRDGHVYEPLRHALFRVSKRVSYEAMEVFFSKCEFCWSFEFGEQRFFNQAPTNRMMNILLEVDMLQHGIECRDEEETGRHPESTDGYVSFDILKDFGGVEILRKTMRIRFHRCSVFTHRIIPTTYFQALKALIGFQTVIVEIRMRYPPYREPAEPHVHYTLRMAMRDVLEPALGPAKIGSVECVQEPHDGYPLDEPLFLEFHPRQYLTQSQGTNTAEAVECSHQDLVSSDLGDSQVDAEALRQMENEATEARFGSRPEYIPTPEQKPNALFISMKEESETCSSCDSAIATDDAQDISTGKDKVKQNLSEDFRISCQDLAKHSD
ncbi:MAG: hypothetical protein Q9161_000234 [Pseudevernia consocians]